MDLRSEPATPPFTGPGTTTTTPPATPPGTSTTPTATPPDATADLAASTTTPSAADLPPSSISAPSSSLPTSAATIVEVAVSALATVVALTTMPEEAPMPVCGMCNNLDVLVEQLRDVAAREGPGTAAADAAAAIVSALRAVIFAAGPPASPRVTVAEMCGILEALMEWIRGMEL